MQPAWSPAGTARHASRGAWKLYRHTALFNRLGLMLAAGQIKNLLVEIQPQIGKSEFWSRYFPAWYVGSFPERRVALVSYAADYARRWGRQARAVIEEHGADLFKIGVSQDSHKADDWSVDGHEGGMITAGVGGQITGRRADLVVVDDPIKNAEEADSKARKDLIWDWWESTVCSRENEQTSKVVMHTRWADDDLAGRIRTEYIKTGKEPWTVLRLPALAEEDESYLDGFWTRKKGECLCPERFSQIWMEAKKNRTSSYWWETLYQQNPGPRKGGFLKVDWFPIVDYMPAARPYALDHPNMVRAWDLAASDDEKAKQSAGIKIVAGADGFFYVVDAVAFWKSSGARDREIVATSKEDGRYCHVCAEQEGGSGGKAQLEHIADQLPGIVFHENSARGSKEFRADALASAAERGRVRLVKAPWNTAFLDQVRRFPSGLIDMIDATAHGYNYLAVGEEEEAAISSDQVIPYSPTGGGPLFGAPPGRIFG